MHESQKPFVCPTPGCKMSFINEDHLSVHKKKHDMVLTLEASSKNAAFFVDQTPTPTRFIRNCEEVGLFQDLHNVNPFDETFRRAVETGKNEMPSVLEPTQNDDSLHTPQIFPHMIDCTLVVDNSIPIQNKSENEVVKQTSNTETTNHCQVLKTSEIVDSLVGDVSDSPKALEATYKQITSPTHLSINGAKVQLLLQTDNGQIMQLLATPLSENGNDNNTVVVETESSLSSGISSKKNSELSLAKVKLKQTLKKYNNNSDSVTNNSTSTPDNADKTTSKKKGRNNAGNCAKQDLLERNRASSMRARAKRKAWVQELEESLHKVNEKNALLQTEVKALRNQVTKLNTLLLAHKDCPVTKAMTKDTNDLADSPKVVTPEAGKSLPVNRGTELQPIAPKKRCFIASKTAALLPAPIIKIDTPIILKSSKVVSQAVKLGEMPVTFITIPQPSTEPSQQTSIIAENTNAKSTES